MKEMEPCATTYLMKVVYENPMNYNKVESYRRFYSRFGAIYVAKKIALCEDVITVDIINDETGELIFYKDENCTIWCED